MFNSFRKLLKTALICAIGALPLGISSSVNAAETIRVGHWSWPGYGFYYVTDHHNLSPDLKFEFTVIEDPVQLFSLLATNKLDVVLSTIEFGPILAAEDMGSKLWHDQSWLWIRRYYCRYQVNE